MEGMDQLTMSVEQNLTLAFVSVQQNMQSNVFYILFRNKSTGILVKHIPYSFGIQK